MGEPQLPAAVASVGWQLSPEEAMRALRLRPGLLSLPPCARAVLSGLGTGGLGKVPEGPVYVSRPGLDSQMLQVGQRGPQGPVGMGTAFVRAQGPHSCAGRSGARAVVQLACRNR